MAGLRCLILYCVQNKLSLVGGHYGAVMVEREEEEGPAMME